MPQLPVLGGVALDSRYSIQKELGQGGVGAVYLARDLKLHDKPVVIKVLLEKSLHIGQRLPRLRCDVATNEVAGDGIARHLAADEDEWAGAQSRTVGTLRRGCVGQGDGVPIGHVLSHGGP